MVACSLGGALSAQETLVDQWPNELVGTWLVVRGIDMPGDPADTGLFVFEKGGRIRAQSIRVKPSLSGPTVERSSVDTLAKWAVQWSAEFRRNILCMQADARRDPVCEVHTIVADTTLIWGKVIFQRRESRESQ